MQQLTLAAVIFQTLHIYRKISYSILCPKYEFSVWQFCSVYVFVSEKVQHSVWKEASPKASAARPY